MNWDPNKKSQRDPAGMKRGPTGIKAKAGPLMVGQLGNTSEVTAKLVHKHYYSLHTSMRGCIVFDSVRLCVRVRVRESTRFPFNI